MTTTTSRLRSTTTGTVVKENQVPRISDLVPGAVIYRWATTRTFRIVAELPCHRDQMASVVYDSRTAEVTSDQPVVCRRCCMMYAATPVPATDEYARYRIVYRHAGAITMSRPRRSGE